MPLPSGIQTITVYGTFLDSFGNPQSGNVIFQPPPQLIDPGSSIIYGKPTSANLDSSGHFSVTLVCTDNPSLVPVGWHYTVVEQIGGVSRSYPIYLPHTLGSSVDLSTVTPIPTQSGTPALIPSGRVAPGYGALAYDNTWSGANTFTGSVTFTGTVFMPGYVANGSAAGGDLSGVYPNPGVAKINGVLVTGTPTAGQVIAATSATTATWQNQTGGSGGGGIQPPAGDIGGTVNNPTVVSTHLAAALPLAQGGTAATSAVGARASLGLGSAATAAIDTTATDIQPLGTRAAGSTGQVADAGHVHAMPSLDQLGAAAADLNIGSHKLTAVAAGVASTDAANVSQLPVVPAAATTVTSATAYGVASAVGTAATYAREDHNHGSPSLTSTAPATTLGIGQAAALGTATTPAKADHVHPLAAAAAPTASAVGDASATGTATTFAASDHKHAREGFGAVTAQTAYGASSANGTATTLAHSDHTHGTPALTTTAPATTLAIGTAAALGTATLPALADHVHPMAASAAAGASAVGDTAAAGSATTFAASDHRHARENFATPGTSAVGDAAAAGTSTSVAHADHTHGREAFGAVVAQTSYGAASANGSATTVSHSDHTHGTPALPTTAQIGAANRLTPTGVKTAAYTAQAGEAVIVDATSANVPITLVSAPADGTVIAVKMIATASGHTATVTCGGTDVYNKTGGATVATLYLTAQAILLQYSAGSGIWYVLGDDLPLSQLDSRYVAKASPVNLTDGATIATDASLGNLFRVTLGGNRTLSNPTNATDGQLMTWSLKQDSTGSRTITLDTKFRFGTDITSITLTTTPSKTDHLGARYNAVDDKFDVIAFVRGY